MVPNDAAVQDNAPPQTNAHWAAMLQHAHISTCITLLEMGRVAEENQRIISALRRARAAANGPQQTAPSVLLQATDLKQKGNALFGDGEYMAAATAYTRAIDSLHGISEENTTLPAQVQAMLATCLSNRSECRLQVSSKSLDGTSHLQGLARAAAAADCAYVQARLLKRYFPHSVWNKTQSCAQMAEAIVVSCSEVT